MAYILDKLTAQHQLDPFSCGVAVLDEWLKEHAFNSERQGSATTYVWHSGDHVVVGYFALSMCSVKRDSLPRRYARGAIKDNPSILIGKLALDQKLHGKGIGGDLLHSAFVVADRLTDIITARLVVVDALNEEVAHFYERYGFVPFMDSSVRLARKLSDIRKDLA